MVMATSENKAAITDANYEIGGTVSSFESFLASVSSHIYIKPNENDLLKVSSLYKKYNKGDNKNLFLKSDDLNQIKVDEKDLTLNYVKFDNLKTKFSITFDPKVSENTVILFKLLLQNMFSSYYKTKINNNDFVLESEDKYSNFIFNPPLSPNILSSIAKQSLYLPANTNVELKIPLGFIINKIEGNKSLSEAEGQPILQRFFISCVGESIDNINQVINTVFYDNQIVGTAKYSYYVQLVKLTLQYSANKQVPETYIFDTKFVGQGLSSLNNLIIPNTPNVNIKNYANINNKFLILLNVRDGTFSDAANDIDLFSPEQIVFFKKMITSSGQSYVNNQIYSNSLNQEKYFLIYRTNIKPQSYSDIIVEENIIKKLDVTKSETSFDDKIKPNKKYYYCFRVESLSGSRSDVTLVYELEMIDQSGTVYMTQTAFKPELQTNFISELDFENRVRFFPNDTQINIPDKLTKVIKVTIPDPNSKEEKDRFITFDNVVIGFKTFELYNQDTIFNSKIFKARITSQNSKKKFDVNINYSINITDAIKLLKDAKNITKEFEILKTEPISK